MKRNAPVINIIIKTLLKSFLLSIGLLLTVAGTIFVSLIPPLVLGKIIDRITMHQSITISVIMIYFIFISAGGILSSIEESLLIILGQKITHALRSELCRKLTLLTADNLSRQEPGVMISRFLGDVNTVESLFTSGIISMFADTCKIISILVIIWMKSRGLAFLLFFLLPVIFLFTRFAQKRMLAAQLNNRKAVSRVTNHVPETFHCIRMIHTLGKESYMEQRYDDYIGESYRAIEKNNFYDSIYSPVILTINAIMVASVMLLSSSGNPQILDFFGMTAGTAVAIINYISQIFSPIESLGMEIQTIQSAAAGVKRINDFLLQEEKWNTAKQFVITDHENSIILDHVSFSYYQNIPVLNDVHFSIKTGEHITISGRTGAGKSTLFKLLLGLYKPQAGHVLINGMDASLIPDSAKRQIFGYVEQSFHAVPGTIKDQITLFDEKINDEMVENALRIVGLEKTISDFKNGLQTICTPSLLSQGQWQLLSIARAVAAQPPILLLDEITANLDADTEQTVLEALKKASKNRTVVSISHRLYQHDQGRIIEI